MRKILLLCLAFCSCSKEKEDVGFTFQEIQIEVLDSIMIQEDSLPFGFTFNEKVFNDSLMVLGDGTFSSIHLFNLNSGKLINSFNEESIFDYPIPSRSYSNSFISNDSLYLLNHLTNEIFCFSFDKKFLSKIELKIDQIPFVLDMDNVFELRNSKWYISSKADGSISDVFNSSKLVSVFNKDGVFLYAFGEYPKEYTEGPLVLSHNENFLFKNDFIYSVNVAGKPILKEYNLDGALISETDLKSQYFQEEIGYHTGDPFSAPLTDQISNLATDQNKNSKVFYLTYSTFSTRDFELGLGSYRLILMEVDLDKKRIGEVELLGSDYLSHTAELLPNVKGDTLSFLIREKDQNLYLKKIKLIRN
jgi:hypothetical protein